VGEERVRGQNAPKENLDIGSNANCQELAAAKGAELQGMDDFMDRFFKVKSLGSENALHLADNPDLQECSTLTQRLLSSLSLALNLPEECSLGQHHSASNFTLSLIRYPSLSAQTHPGTGIRNAAHSDFGTLTLLFQDTVGGLQIADMTTASGAKTTAEVERTADFLDVHPHPGRILVNPGYLLMRWSNRRWKSTVHRVTVPPEYDVQCKQSVPERYSIAFFSSPDPDTTIEALPGCYDEANPKHFEPLNAGAYLLKKRSDVRPQDNPRGGCPPHPESEL